MNPKLKDIYEYEVWLENKDGEELESSRKRFIAVTPGGALFKSYIYCSIKFNSSYRECFDGLKIRYIGIAQLSHFFGDIETFNHVKERRRIEFAELGMKVNVHKRDGYIVGGCSGLNLSVFFPEGNYTSSYHPYREIVYYDHAGNIIMDYRGKSVHICSNCGRVIVEEVVR